MFDACMKSCAGNRTGISLGISYMKNYGNLFKTMLIKIKWTKHKTQKTSSVFFDLASLIYIVTSLLEWHMQNAVTEERKKLASSHKVEDDELRDEKFNKLTRIWRITEALSKACHLQTLLSWKCCKRKKSSVDSVSCRVSITSHR